MAKFTSKYEMIHLCFTKSFFCDPYVILKEKSKIAVEMVRVVSILNEYNLIEVISIEQSEKKLKDPEWKNPMNWIELIEDNEFIEINGNTTILNAEQEKTTLSDIIDCFIATDIHNIDDKCEIIFTFHLSLLSDDWLPYYIINQLTVNPSYLENAKQLEKALIQVNHSNYYEVEISEDSWCQLENNRLISSYDDGIFYQVDQCGNEVD